MTTTAPLVVHRYDGDDRCVCGGMAVYWDDPDPDGFTGDGCETGGVWPIVRRQAVCPLCDLPLSEAPAARMADPHFWDERPLGCRPDFHVHVACGLSEGLEVAS